MTGDFNLILNEADKSKDRIDRVNLRRFRRAVSSLELQVLHLHGRCFTWSNERENPTLVRLDRVLVSIDWDALFPNAHLRGLGSDASDHCPLLLQTNLGQMSKARFHFESFWPTFDDYGDVVAAAWTTPATTADPLLRLDCMLRSLVRSLQSWAASRIGEIKAQLLMARAVVLRMDIQQEQRLLNQPDRTRLQKAHENEVPRPRVTRKNDGKATFSGKAAGRGRRQHGVFPHDRQGTEAQELHSGSER